MTVIKIHISECIWFEKQLQSIPFILKVWSILDLIFLAPFFFCVRVLWAVSMLMCILSLINSHGETKQELEKKTLVDLNSGHGHPLRIWWKQWALSGEKYKYTGKLAFNLRCFVSVFVFFNVFCLFFNKWRILYSVERNNLFFHSSDL